VVWGDRSNPVVMAARESHRPAVRGVPTLIDGDVQATGMAEREREGGTVPITDHDAHLDGGPPDSSERSVARMPTTAGRSS
jgi:hypothetical protein